MTARTSAGTVVSIGPAPATLNAEGFNAVTVQAIGEVTDAGEYGKVFALVTHNPLSSRKTEKYKGSFNNGSITLALALDEADAGQVAARSALETDDSFTIKVTKQDGSIDFFTAQVMSFTTSIGSVDSIESGSIMLEIDSNIVPVAAT